MRVALVGAGEVGLRLATEFCKSEDEVVVLTSTVKSKFGHLKAEINLTDYSVDDLTKNWMIATRLCQPSAAQTSSTFISAHSNILEACHQSRRCKHFIPSEWNINIEDFPDSANIQCRRARGRSQKTTVTK